MKNKSQERILNVLTVGKCEPAAMPTEDVAKWLHLWRNLFAQRLHEATGEWLLHEYDWHVFSYNHHEARTGDAAWAEFRRIEAGAFVVLSAWSGECFGFTCNGKPPDRLKAGVDILVAPTSLAWTMAFTHEEPVLGPYFAERRTL